MNQLFAEAFELFGLAYQGQLSDDLFRIDAYSTMGYITLSLALLGTLMYYIFLDRPRGVGWVTWLIYGAVTSLIIAVITAFYLGNRFDNAALDYLFEDYLGVVFIALFWGFVLYFVFSLIVKRFSVNRRRSPF